MDVQKVEENARELSLDYIEGCEFRGEIILTCILLFRIFSKITKKDE